MGNCVNANLNKFWECLKVQMWGVITQQQKSVEKCLSDNDVSTHTNEKAKDVAQIMQISKD